MKILAIASGGGHWQQLMLLRPAFEGCEVKFITTLAGLPERSQIADYDLVHECNRNDFKQIAANAWRLIGIISRFKPDVVVSTGALPGLLAIAIAKVLFRKRTIWVDSVANALEFSMSGRLAKRYADLWISQWENVARASGSRYYGRVI